MKRGLVLGAAFGALAVLSLLLLVGFRVVFPDADAGGVGQEPGDAASAHGPAGPPSASVSSSATPEPSETPTRPAPPPPPELTFLDSDPKTREEQHEALFATIRAHYDLDDSAMEKVREIFSAKRIGQGDPGSTKHPMTKRECLDIRAKAGLEPVFDERCGHRNMVPIYDPKAGETKDTARVCIDQYEFPNIACEYPVTWVSAREAVLLCQAVGKRLCDAHEWEGACAGAVLPIEKEYHWKLDRKNSKGRHNQDREKVWAYGPKKDHSLCATGSTKSDKCGDGGKCGSNTYPAGAFPKCKSPFGVYDQHGNAAEHMNLPMGPDEVAQKGKYGQTEMKGSWFIFQSYEAHEDDCRWRAPDWHGGDVMAVDSHANYHLGFRCCGDVAAPDVTGAGAAE